MANAVSAYAVSKAFFTPDCGEPFNYSPETSDPENLGLYLFQKAQQHYVASFGIQALEEFPESAWHLLQVLQPILHPLYLDRLEKECESFNLLVGGRISSAEDPGLTSDAIVASMTNGDWLEDICLAISNACFKEVAPNVGQAPVSPHQPRLIPQFDGPSDSDVRAGRQMIGPIAQVTIVGPSLKEAWARCSYTRNLERYAPQEPSWNQNQPGGMYVYHGTAAYLGSSRALVDLTSHPFAGLEGRCTRNQITQDGSGLPVAWTAFSPFRAFLWAVFGAEVSELGQLGSPSTPQFCVADPRKLVRRRPHLQICQQPAQPAGLHGLHHSARSAVDIFSAQSGPCAEDRFSGNTLVSISGLPSAARRHELA
ncbi:hypothetical protein K4F52_002427 [Lecanicillium sp. MT-2017a]|nr:hypothetical protein K4F52_002427 [Lecanicillium sp. MT-2017a]